jgi:hypothetical protein
LCKLIKERIKHVLSVLALGAILWFVADFSWTQSITLALLWSEDGTPSYLRRLWFRERLSEPKITWRPGIGSALGVTPEFFLRPVAQGYEIGLQVEPFGGLHTVANSPLSFALFLLTNAETYSSAFYRMSSSTMSTMRS